MKVNNTYNSLPDILYDRNQSKGFPNAAPILFNKSLLNELGINFEEDQLLKIFSAQTNFPESESLSLAYSGHQFGYFNPTLGDGRAHLIAQIDSDNGSHFDIQLKGSGRTKYSRNGDGLSSLGPVIREYIVSEAMHALGVPTTRALAAVKTNESVYREEELPGGVFTRLAASHLRVGSFEFLYSRDEFSALEELVNYAQKRHYPQSTNAMEFFKAVSKNKIMLVTQWLGLGFIHGVMNTDNTSIAGITIDYGPCAFLDEYNSEKVFSSIDRHGRYRYNNQIDIALWNLSVFANAIFPVLVKERQEEQVIKELKDFFLELEAFAKDQWLQVFSSKIGIQNPKESDRELINELLNYMEKEKLDFTNTFRSLSSLTFKNSEWQEKWLERLEETEEAKTLMDSVNPYIIPRNHQVEKAIELAIKNDFSHFYRLVEAYKSPYDVNSEYEDLTKEPALDERVYQTFCGT